MKILLQTLSFILFNYLAMRLIDRTLYLKSDEFKNYFPLLRYLLVFALIACITVSAPFRDWEYGGIVNIQIYCDLAYSDTFLALWIELISIIYHTFFILNILSRHSINLSRNQINTSWLQASNMQILHKYDSWRLLK